MSLAKALGTMGHRVKIYTLERQTNGLGCCNVDVVFVPSKLFVKGYYPLVPSMEWVGGMDADVVNFSGPTFSEDLLLPILKALRYPTVATYHADFHTQNPIVGSYYLLKCRGTLRLADRVIVTTQRYRLLLAKRGLDQSSIRVIPPGVDTSTFRPPSPNEKANLKLKYRIRDKAVLFVGGMGRLHPYKGLGVLLKAFREMRNSLDADLVLVGSGDAATHYDGCCKTLGIRDRVKFLGRLDRQRLAEVYQLADAFVLPSTSRAEGFGMAALEAMASGCPAIVSNISGVAELVSKLQASLVFRANDDLDLTYKLRRLLLDEDLCQQLAKYGCSMIRRLFDWKVIAERVEEVYEEALHQMPWSHVD